MNAIEPGIRQGVTRADYDAIPAVNQSLLKLFRRSPAHARVQMLEPSEPTDSQELGTAIHTAILEPARFAASYAVSPKFDRRTTKGKADAADFASANVGKTIIDADDMAICQGVGEGIAANETAAGLLSAWGKNELGVVWIDADTGLACKALIDRVTSYDGSTCVVDLKSTQDASPFAFASDANKFGYYVQAAFYLDGLHALAPAARRFLFVAVEKAAPFGVAVHELDDESLAVGRREYRDYLRQYAECQKSGFWPCYSASINTIRLPNWKLNLETSHAV